MNTTEEMKATKEPRVLYNFKVIIEGHGEHNQRDVSEMSAAVAVFNRLRLTGMTYTKYQVVRIEQKKLDTQKTGEVVAFAAQ